jgi:argininosuccinate lyase
VTTLGYLLVVRERLLALTRALLAAMQALLTLAEGHLDTLMPDYTYLPTAHPTSLAHYLLTFVQPMSRDLARLQAVFERVNLSPAGAGSTNGSRLPLQRERLAELLGFAGVVTHTRDAMWQPDVPIEVMSGLVAMLVNADRLAEDLQLWATAEFNFIDLADRHTRISVIMPHKKNPYSLAFIRGVAREMIGRWVSVAAVGATPSGQVDNRIFIYGGVPRAMEQARQAMQLLAGVVAGLEVNRAVLAQRVQQGFGGATDLTEVIMLECNLDTHTAHRIVGRAVRLALENEVPLSAALLDEAAQAIIERPLALSEETISDTLNPTAIVNSRTGVGGASPSSTQAMLATFRQTVAEGERWRQDWTNRLTAAEKALLAQVEALCQRT